MSATPMISIQVVSEKRKNNNGGGAGGGLILPNLFETEREKY